MEIYGLTCGNRPRRGRAARQRLLRDFREVSGMKNRQLFLYGLIGIYLGYARNYMNFFKLFLALVTF